MLRSVHNSRNDGILRKKLEEKNTLNKLEEIDSKLLEKLINFLEFFEKISLECQEDKKVSIIRDCCSFLNPLSVLRTFNLFAGDGFLRSTRLHTNYSASKA